jgi:hypothetical protein
VNAFLDQAKVKADHKVDALIAGYKRDVLFANLLTSSRIRGIEVELHDIAAPRLVGFEANYHLDVFDGQRRHLLGRIGSRCRVSHAVDHSDDGEDTVALGDDALTQRRDDYVRPTVRHDPLP